MFHKQPPRILPETAATSKLQIGVPSGICVKVILEKKVVLSWGKTGYQYLLQRHSALLSRETGLSFVFYIVFP